MPYFGGGGGATVVGSRYKMPRRFRPKVTTLHPGPAPTRVHANTLGTQVHKHASTPPAAARATAKRCKQILKVRFWRKKGSFSPISGNVGAFQWELQAWKVNPTRIFFYYRDRKSRAHSSPLTLKKKGRPSKNGTLASFFLTKTQFYAFFTFSRGPLISGLHSRMIARGVPRTVVSRIEVCSEVPIFAIFRHFWVIFTISGRNLSNLWLEDKSDTYTFLFLARGEYRTARPMLDFHANQMNSLRDSLFFAISTIFGYFSPFSLFHF